jgi:hypothetical protein
MSNQLICSCLFITAVLLMTIEAFPIVQWGGKASMTTRQQRTFFASAPVVFMSETAEEATSTASDATDASPVVSETAAVASTEFEMTPEEAAAKRKVQRERNTLFVGNLPFGKFDILFTLCVFLELLSVGK